MHELSIAQALVEQLEEIRKREGASRIVRCRVAVGRLSGVDRGALEAAFPLAAEGWPIQPDALDVREVPVSVRCRRCSAETRLEELDFRCSACQSIEVDLAAGREIQLESVDLDVPEPEPDPA